VGECAHEWLRLDNAPDECRLCGSWRTEEQFHAEIDDLRTQLAALRASEKIARDGFDQLCEKHMRMTDESESLRRERDAMARERTEWREKWAWASTSRAPGRRPHRFRGGRRGK
jgi:hypothetical protein